MKREVFNKYAEEIAKKFNLSHEDMFSPSRKRDRVDARHMLYHLCKERPMRISYIQKYMEENGLAVCHTTIIHGLKKAKHNMREDKDFKSMTNSINKNV